MTDKTPRRVLDAIYRQPWAIDPAYLPTIIGIAERNLDDVELAGSIQALRSRRLEMLEGTEAAHIHAGTAVVSLIGPVFPRANLMTDLSGAVSLERFTRDLLAADANQDVERILIDVDSPGGVAFGIAEAAGILAGLDTPTTAYVGGLGASAAYWLASAAGEIVVHETALVGSIGVVTAGTVQEAPDQRGERRVEVVSSNAPNKRPDLNSEDGRAVVRAELDALEAIFIAAVAANRGVPAAIVKSDFGRGGVLAGAAAVAVGMADRLGTFESTLAEVSGNSPGPHTAGNPSTMQKEFPSMNDKTQLPETSETAAPAVENEATGIDLASIDLAYLESNHAELVAGIRAEAATAERSRILGIESHAVPGLESLVADMKADAGVTPEAAAGRILEAARDGGMFEKAQSLADLKTDLAGNDVVEASAEAGADTAIDANAPIDERAKAEWDADADIRSEFHGNFKTYLALRRNEDANAKKEV